MNLGDGKRKVLMLLDEYSSGGQITVDMDINNKMNDFFDMAQKDMACYAPILKTAVIELTGLAEEPVPEGFNRYFRVWKDGERHKKYNIIDGKMQTKGETGTITVQYLGDPTTITQSTPDTYEFEVKEDAANCLPFYVAAQQLITDLVVDYNALWQMYLAHKAQVNTGFETGGDSTFRQALFKG